MRIILFGVPGSGLGTQSNFISEKYDILEITVADMVRKAIEAQTPLGMQADQAQSAGETIPNEVILGILKDELIEKADRGYVLDGYPRNEEQARELDEMLSEFGNPVDLVIHLDLDFENAVERLSGRRKCTDCGMVYNNSPDLGDRCVECGGDLTLRSDDKEEMIANRLRIYEMEHRPVLDYYRSKNMVHTVDADGEPEEIFERIDAILNEYCDVPSTDEMESAVQQDLFSVADEPGTETSEISSEEVKNVDDGDEKEIVTKSSSPKKKKKVKKKAAKKKAAAKSKSKKKTGAKKTKAKKKAKVKKAAAKKKAAKKSSRKAKEKVMRKKKSASKKKSVAKKKTRVAKKKKKAASKKKAKKKASKKKASKKKASKKRSKKTGKKKAKKKGRKKKAS